MGDCRIEQGSLITCLSRVKADVFASREITSHGFGD